MFRPPLRIVLNFASKCGLKCPWCYVPFDQSKVEENVLNRVVDRIADLRIRAVTFGGGDPFQYTFSSALIKRAKSKGLFVHVDTHGKSLSRSNSMFKFLSDSVDLIGIPLDGATALIHDSMRNSPGHFAVVTSLLSWLAPFSSRLKINTLISRENAPHITDICAFVRMYSPARWSIYEYWALGPGRSVSNLHSMSDTAFSDLRSIVNSEMNDTAISTELTDRESRRSNYPIIHHDGMAYTHAQAPINSVVTLGSIFNSDFLEKVALFCGGERSSAKDRYA